MNSKGSLGSIVAGVIAIFLILICAFYLSFTFKSNAIESDAQEFAAQNSNGDDASPEYTAAYKKYMDQIGEQPVFMGYTGNEVRRWGVNLGLDLKGGMNVTLQVNMGDLLLSMADNSRSATLLNAIAVTDTMAQKNVELEYVEQFIQEYRKAVPTADFSSVFSNYVTKKGESDARVAEILKAEAQDRVQTSATNVLRNRIDAFGVVSPNIQVIEGKQGQILLELPGVKEHERMIELLKRSANLEFYEVYYINEEPVSKLLNDLMASANGALDGKLLQSGRPDVLAMVKDADRADVMKFFQDNKNRLPSNLKLAWSAKGNKAEDGTEYYELYLLKTSLDEAGMQTPAMTGEYITNAGAELDQLNRNVVSMRMDSEGARLWGNVTKQNHGRPVAVVLDDEVYSAPNINEPILNGSSQISGTFTVQEAQDLANILKSGKMTARISVISSMVVGPSLGKAAIQDGITSFVVALILLAIFMIAMYGFIPGMIADLALVLNIFFTFGILASFQAVLTLSGIAGIVLSLGMAVDANVLIYERAKEELRAGKNARTAIADGYSNAFSAIFDSNLTSIITGLILLIFGTGPIKGFATTLIIGLCCSFFTAVYLTRIVFIAFAKKKAFQNLTFSTKMSKNMFANANFNFLGARKLSFTIVAVVVVAFIVSLFTLQLKPGIDFSGGRNYIVAFDKKMNPQHVQQLLAPKFGDASLSVITVENANQIRISTNYKVNEADADAEIQGILYDTLKGEFANEVSPEEFSTANAAIGLVSSQKVGPTVANDMRKAAVIAVTLALLAMFLYILVRFRNIAFSLGALAAVAFTAFCIIGLYSVCYGFVPFTMEIDQTFIAAILTVIGYQINDTVVVFDRVRENVTLFPKQNFFDLVNRSINSTLGRTVMTSASTLLVLLCIFILGGEAIRAFTFAMIAGVVIGTLATIYIAAPVAYLTNQKLTK